MPLAHGAVVAGRYHVDRPIANGGTSSVWAANVVGSRRQVALKVLLPGTTNQVIVAAFEREADLLGRIYSEFVVRRIDLVTCARYGRILVEELVEGESLRGLISRKRVEVAEARTIGFHVLRALCALERARVVHGDLNPGNIILRPIGGGGQRPVLVDLGAAQLLDGEGGAALGGDYAIGTLEYLAPEQLTPGARLSVAVDLYALGAILYRAIAGRPVFGDRSGVDLVRAKLRESAPRLEVPDGDWMAARLARVLARALERDPADRYRHPDEMLTDLMALPRSDEPVQAAPVQRAAG
jgi:serine/threonine-protein kinase